MICRSSRDSLAKAIQSFLELKSTNEDIHELELEMSDMGVEYVYEAMWMMNSDFKTHTASHLPSSLKSELQRYIYFLKSDIEYQWPDTRPNKFLMLLTFGLAYTHRRRETFKAAGDYSVWPFISEDEYRAAQDAFKGC